MSDFDQTSSYEEALELSIKKMLQVYGCHLNVDEKGDFVVSSPNKTLQASFPAPLTFEKAQLAKNALERMALECA